MISITALILSLDQSIIEIKGNFLLILSEEKLIQITAQGSW
jgi:hypothetical protein